MRVVAALFVDALGPYTGMPDVDCWTEQRNAHLYNGPHPVVAHPACGPWGRLYKNCSKQNPEDAIHALSVVREYGGVLEHPANSKLWKRFGLPAPGSAGDSFGGHTVALNQVSYGHTALKPTWLYVVRAQVPKLKTGGVPTHYVAGNLRRMPNGRMGLPLTKLERRLTPPDFADLLVQIARTVQ